MERTVWRRVADDLIERHRIEAGRIFTRLYCALLYANPDGFDVGWQQLLYELQAPVPMGKPQELKGIKAELAREFDL